MPSLEFDPDALEDLAWWIEHDRKKASRLLRLIIEVGRTPFEGTGHPEPLKHDLVGCWSRRIDKEHRLVYQIEEDAGELKKIRIVSCRHHY